MRRRPSRRAWTVPAQKGRGLCRPLPYHFVCVLQEPRYFAFFKINTIATCPSVGPYRLAVSFWLKKRIS